mmetsp:Transcript_152247/g.486493  ORF Transcript_152247/g.486493 Transcript_152247/m.486493 type:complete len:114 (-) Transcript_152247:1984-2325(-)
MSASGEAIDWKTLGNLNAGRDRKSSDTWTSTRHCTNSLSNSIPSNLRTCSQTSPCTDCYPCKVQAWWQMQAPVSVHVWVQLWPQASGLGWAQALVPEWAQAWACAWVQAWAQE